jgi:hypothetical protein
MRHLHPSCHALRIFLQGPSASAAGDAPSFSLHDVPNGIHVKTTAPVFRIAVKEEKSWKK